VRANGVRDCAACKRDRARRSKERRKAARPLPLVLSATKSCREQANRLGLERAVENVVADAIAAGRTRPAGGAFEVTLDGGLVALVERSQSRITGRPAWQPVRIARASGTGATRRRAT
jgi:hypothetical protein